MYIITQGAPLENSIDRIYTVQATALERGYIEAGYQRRERIFKLTYKHGGYIVICPEFRNGGKGAEPIVIIPEFLVPGRRYPVEVYLYAIDLYSREKGKGQRWAAAEARKRYGLEKAEFAHTTLGRALKKLSSRLEEIGEAKIIGAHESGGKDAANAEGMRQHSFNTVRTTWELRERVTRFLCVKAVEEDLRSAEAVYRGIAREWFEKHRQLLL